MDFKDYGDSSVTPPPAGDDYEKRVVSWVLEGVSEGESFLRAQPGYSSMDPIIKGIMSHDTTSTMLPAALSRARSNRLGKIALDLRAGLTDTKIFWEYSTNNHRYDQSATMATKLARAWWLQSQADQRFADGIAWCLPGGSAAMRLVYSKSSGQQELQAWDIRDVLPVRVNDYNDYDSGFAVIGRKENTVNYLRALYPAKAARILPDRDGSSVRLGSGSIFDKLATVASPLLRGLMRDSSRSASQLKVPSCDTYIIEVKDDSLNKSGHAVLMGPHDSQGRPESPWSYAVEPGDPLYPRGRTIICTKTCVLYDGPNIYWHGRFSFLKLTLDQWPYSFLGKSPLVDILPLQDSYDEALRLLANTIKKLQRPGLIADKNSVSKAMWDKLDTALPGMKAMQNPSMGKGLQVVETDPGVIAAVLPYLQMLSSEMEFVSGSKDVTNLAELGQVPSSETIEKMLMALSPAIRSRSRTLEAFLRPLAQMVLSGFMEFYTQAKRIRILGPNGAVLDDFDADPGTLIPDFVHESDFDAHGNVRPEALRRGPKSRYDRALTFMSQFSFNIQPGSLLAASEVSKKLLMLQLGRAGYIDVVTLLESLDIPNIGVPPNIPSTIIDRLKWQETQGIGMAANSAGRKATGQTMPIQRPNGKISESGS